MLAALRDHCAATARFIGRQCNVFKIEPSSTLRVRTLGVAVAVLVTSLMFERR